MELEKVAMESEARRIMIEEECYALRIEQNLHGETKKRMDCLWAATKRLGDILDDLRKGMTPNRRCLSISLTKF